MHRRLITAAVITALATAISAHAGPQNGKHGHFRYRWVDAHGLPHFSDSLSEQAIRRGYEVINDQGLVVRHVPRPMNAKERAAAAAKAKADEAAAKEHAQQQADDQQLLEAYPTEAIYAATQKAELDNMAQSIHTTRLNLKSQEQALADLLSHAASIQAGGGSVPAFLNARISHQRAAVAQQRDTLKRQQQARVKAEKDVQQRLAHYRALKAREKSQDDIGSGP